MAENPWEGFEDPNYELEDIGRPAVFLVPKRVLVRDVRVELEKYLEDLGGFQRPDSLVSGVYRTADGAVMLDKCVQYEVSFLGKERIPGLMLFLSNLAHLTGEECIYFKAGEDACLIRPR